MHIAFDYPAIVVGPGIIGFDVDGLVKIPERAGIITLFIPGNPPVIIIFMNPGAVRLELDGFG